MKRRRRTSGGVRDEDALDHGKRSRMDTMREPGEPTIEQILEARGTQNHVLTPHERRGGWRAAFGDVAGRVPRPYWLFTEDERDVRGPGLPIQVSPVWERFCKELANLAGAESRYRLAVSAGEKTDKAPLVELRNGFVQRLADFLENATLYDYNRRIPETLWLALSREVAEKLRSAVKAARGQTRDVSSPDPSQLRYGVAEQFADLCHRAEAEMLARLRRLGEPEPRPSGLAFGRLIRDDLLPFAIDQLSGKLSELDPYLRSRLAVDPARFHDGMATAASDLAELRDKDIAFSRALALTVPEAQELPAISLVFLPAVLELLDAWQNPLIQRLPTDVRSALSELGPRLKRFEVVAAMRGCLIPVTVRGSTVVGRFLGETVHLSASTRPLDFGAPGVVDSSVRRYGLLYDLVEFTHILGELRRRGRSVEENALRSMTAFQQRIDEIQRRHRLRFEKFLGDGAFFSARRASSVLFASAELRLLYERLRGQGLPFDRGLRLAVNVGTYHLFPMLREDDDRPRFEFLGHGLVELARLTTGKTTHEVEDIADFLIASGYDVHRVLEFLEPVRHGRRYPDHVRERTYAAFIAENAELVNVGGVATEEFLQELEGELAGTAMSEGERWGLRWLLVPCSGGELEGCSIGLRFLGTARLKGLDPIPLAEMVVFDRPLQDEVPHPEGTRIVDALQRFGRAPDEASPETPSGGLVDPHLCVASALEEPQLRAWYLGQYHEEVDALFHAFRVPLNTVELGDGEPFESWLFRHRQELAQLYKGLRRDGQGATVSLQELRGREGYFACLLHAPHRSPR